jgi:hypothetical protein
MHRRLLEFFAFFFPFSKKLKETSILGQLSTMSMMNIPGYFFDPIKKKYFKIGTASSAASSAEQQYTESALSLKRRQEEHESVAKLAKQRRLAKSSLLPKPATRISLLKARSIYGSEIQADTLEIGRISRLKYKSEFSLGGLGVVHEISRDLDCICFGLVDGDISIMNLKTGSQKVHERISDKSEMTSCVLRADEHGTFVINTELEDGIVRIHDEQSQAEIFRRSIPGVTLWSSDIVPGSAFGILHLVFIQ